MLPVLKSLYVVSEDHRHPPDEERRIREASLDETIAGTFPASDPLSTIPNPDEHDALADDVEPARAPDAAPRPGPA